MDNSLAMIVVSSLGQMETIYGDVLPRVGDKIDMFYRPYPTVNSVLLWPAKETLESFGFPGEEIITAIVTVE